MIRTPDQKLRVFISSTIQELAEERRIAREAITRLRLIPVLFEMGARPHPPRDLYRAYLEQSQVFIGIYWNSYGWIAPGTDISGIEDEFNLSKDKPRLVYVKEAAERQPRLQQLLQKIQDTESVCYQKFSSPEELQELMENDLALLLSERFHEETKLIAAVEKQVNDHIPFTRSRIIGREEELHSLQAMLSLPEVGLITITGAGGTGKTRLSVQLLHEVKAAFPDGVYFIPLASTSDPSLVPSMIAHELGLADSGRQSIEETLLEYLYDKKLLLLLDNFEQIADASLLLCRILEQCPLVKLVVTSRTPLHLREENVFPLSPLANAGETTATEKLQEFPAIQLFIQRAKEINPALVTDEKNLLAIAAICKKLDGLPLAIELAASRTKLFPPPLLLSRMGKTLDILAHGPKDMPQRHQTIRATIDWSYNLLDEQTQKFFRRLSVFAGNWTADAAEAIINLSQPGVDVMEATERLIDLGLLKTYTTESESGEIDIRFRMLQVIKEYAYEMLGGSPEELKEAEKAHAAYYVQKANEWYDAYWNAADIRMNNDFDREYDNLRLAFKHLLKTSDRNRCWQLIGTLPDFWLRSGGYAEAFEWIRLAGVNTGSEETGDFADVIDSAYRARAYLCAGILHYFAGHYSLSISNTRTAVDIYKSIPDERGEGRSKAYLGLASLNAGNLNAIVYLTEAIESGRKNNDLFTFVGACSFLTEVYIATGQYNKAAELLQQTEKTSKEKGSFLSQGMVSIQKGNLNYQMDKPGEAIEDFSRSIEQFARAGFDAVNGWSYINMGICLIETGKVLEAREYLETGLQNGRKRGEKIMQLMSLLGFARLYAANNEMAKAIKIYSAVNELKETVEGYNTWSTNKKTYDLVSHSLCEALSDLSFTGDVEEGRLLSFEQLIAIVTRGNEVAVSTII